MISTLKIKVRKYHRWISVIIALPILITIVTGNMLMLRGKFEWIQPSGSVGTIKNESPKISYDIILNNVKTVNEANVKNWEDISDVIYKPAKGTFQVRTKNNYEIQIDALNGNILKTAYRRTSLLTSLHQGSFFSPFVMNFIFFPSAFLLFTLWLTGIYLFFITVKRKKLISQVKKEDLTISV